MWLVRLCVSFSFISPLASVLFNCSSSIAEENVLTDEFPLVPQVDAGVGLLRYSCTTTYCGSYYINLTLNMQVGLEEETDN